MFHELRPILGFRINDPSMAQPLCIENSCPFQQSGSTRLINQDRSSACLEIPTICNIAIGDITMRDESVGWAKSESRGPINETELSYGQNNN